MIKDTAISVFCIRGRESNKCPAKTNSKSVWSSPAVGTMSRRQIQALSIKIMCS